MLDDEDGDKEEEDDGDGIEHGSIQDELELIRAGVRKYVVGNTNIQKKDATLICSRIDRYEKVIVRMSVENERLASMIKAQEKLMEVKMEEMERRIENMGKVMEKVVEGAITGVLEKVERKLEVMCMNVENRLCVNEAPVRETAQPGVARNATPGKSYALIVKGANEKLTGMEVKRRMIESVNDNVLKVKGMRTTRNGEVVVEAASEEDRRRLANCPLGDAGLCAVAPKRMNPRVIIFGIPSTVPDATIFEELVGRNLNGLVSKEDVEKRIRVVRREKRGNAQVDNVILELPHECKDKLVSVGRVYVGWMSYRVNVCERVQRCYSCLSFGHKMSECKVGKVCYKCGEKGHLAKACGGSESCTNCKQRGLPSGHSALWTGCPEYEWRLNVLRRRVNG